MTSAAVLTSAEAAHLLGITTGHLRMLVHRGKLTPIRRGARPLRFHRAHVVDLQRQRQTRAERDEIAATWAAWDAEVARQRGAV